MKILITGGSGFVGSRLTERLLDRGDKVTIVGRSPEKQAHMPTGVKYLSGKTTRHGAWQEAVAEQDALVNLAGASIFKRWTSRIKQQIYESRILTTRNLVEAIPENTDTVLCSTSAVGYYGFRGDEPVTENDDPGDDFLARLARDWEREALKAEDKGARVVLMRFGIVLGGNGGALDQMLKAFKSYVGGPIGNGRQWFSWIHMEDLVSAILFAIDRKQLSGPANFCAPTPVTNKELARALGKVLGRPAFMPTPGFALKAIMGEFGSVLLEGQRVQPTKLQEQGFDFQYMDLEHALCQIVGT